MYYVTGMTNSRICVRDTKDRVSEWIGITDLRDLYKSGVEIKGVGKGTGNGIPFKEFSISFEDSRSLIASKCALTMGIVIHTSSVNGCILDITECKLPCTILLDDIYARITSFDIRDGILPPLGKDPIVTLRIGRGIFSVDTGHLDDFGRGVILDISDAQDDVWWKLFRAYSKSLCASRLKLGERGILPALYGRIFKNFTALDGCRITDTLRFVKGILKDKNIDAMFLAKYKSNLIVPRDGYRFVRSNKFNRVYKMREVILKIENCSQFSRLMHDIYVYTDEKLFDGIVLNGVSLRPIWTYFCYGGTDVDIYKAFRYALSRMESA